MKKNPYEGLNLALRRGCSIKCFREIYNKHYCIVRVEKNGKLRGYGEAISAENALKRAAENYLKHDEVNILKKKFRFKKSPSELSSWIWEKNNNSFSVVMQNGEVIFKMAGALTERVSKEITDRVRETGISETHINSRGYVILSEMCEIVGYSEIRTAVNSCCIQGPPHDPEHKRLWYQYYGVKIGKGQDFENAMLAAISAPIKETDTDERWR